MYGTQGMPTFLSMHGPHMGCRMYDALLAARGFVMMVSADMGATAGQPVDIRLQAAVRRPGASNTAQPR